MATFPLVMTAAGPQPTDPATLRAGLDADLVASDPGYTSRLPGSLIEDVLSTQVAGLALMDQARVDAVNSISVASASPFVLNALAQAFGVSPSAGSAASVEVQFSGTAGYIVPQNFIISDGATQYITQDAVTIPSSGASSSVTALAQSTTNTIPAATVTTVISAVPPGYTVNVTNALAGSGTLPPETTAAFRTRVMGAFSATMASEPQAIRTAIGNANVVASRLLSVQQTANGWKVVAGAGDADTIAGAIYASVGNPALLQGSQLAIASMTAANPVVITTTFASNFAAGQTLTVTGANPSTYNGTYTVASTAGNAITTSTNGSAFGAYVSDAKINPNPRTNNVSVFDNPDTYTITFVTATAHTVDVTVTWTTLLQQFNAAALVNNAAETAITQYLNSIPLGAPLNYLSLSAAFQNAVNPILSVQNISSLLFDVMIDGQTQTGSETSVQWDSEGYFNAGTVTVTQVS